MKARRLTPSQRYQIHERLQDGQTQAQAARALGVSPSTVSEELRRNGGREAYDPQAAQARAERLARGKAKPRVKAKVWRRVERQLRKKRWSPEIISLWLKYKGYGEVSHTWIYEYIRRDRAAGGDLYTFLPQPKRWRKRPGRANPQGRVPNRTGIEERPAEVEERREPGHYEVDTMVGARGQGTFVTIVERSSRYGFIVPVPNRTKKVVCDAVIKTLRPHDVKSITSDNGREFNDHGRASATLGARWFHCHPQASWERGTNENFNRNVRLFCPKGTDLSDYSRKRVREVQDLVNHRPRKCLGMRTPHEVFFGTA